MNFTVDEFKAQFPRFSPMFLPIYEVKTYFLGDIVYYTDNFYKCIVSSTNNAPNNTTDWELYNDSTLNYTTDEDIQEAIQEAGINFNCSFFEDCSQKKTVFGLLVAHYLTVDFNNALGINQVGLPTSKSVGSVSEGYSIPNWMTANAALSAYATTGYGIKYASLIQPYLCGQIILTPGRTTYD